MNRVYYADFLHGQVILPQVVTSLLQASFCALPKTSCQNQIAATLYAWWQNGMGSRYPEITLVPTKRLQRWLVEPATDWLPVPADAHAVDLPRLLVASLPGFSLPWNTHQAQDRLALWWWFIERFAASYGFPQWAEELLSRPSQQFADCSQLMEGIIVAKDKTAASRSAITASERLDALRSMHTLLPDVPLPACLQKLVNQHAPCDGVELPLLLHDILTWGAQFTSTPDNSMLLWATGTYFVSLRKELPAHVLSPSFIATLLKKNEKNSCLLLDACAYIAPVAQSSAAHDPRQTAWFVQNVLFDLPFSLPLWITDTWKQPAAGVAGTGYTLLAEGLRLLSPDLAQLSSTSATNREAVVKQLLKGGNIPADWLCSGQAMIPSPDKQETSRHNDLTALFQKQSGGITIAGWGGSVSGVGEDVRGTCLALTSTKIPFSLLDVTASVPHGAALDASLLPKPPLDTDYSVRIVHLAAQDFYRWRMATPDRQWAGAYYCGFFPWELPLWPDEHLFMLESVDEIWAPSTFIMEAFRNAPRHKRKMPLVVHIPDDVMNAALSKKDDARARLGIAPDDYLFLFTMDASSYRRKNPEAVIEAFLAARRNTRMENARLVIKSMNARYAKESYAQLVAMAEKAQAGILLVDELYDRVQTVALMAACDCYVSLHRAEGFGRGMAEAMLLQKTVIASQYSGNTDFTRNDNALLVSGGLTEVPEGGSLPGMQQMWFDPDTEVAAQQMQRAYENDSQISALRKQAQQTIENEYSPSVVGAAMREALAPFLGE